MHACSRYIHVANAFLAQVAMQHAVQRHHMQAPNGGPDVARVRSQVILLKVSAVHLSASTNATTRMGQVKNGSVVNVFSLMKQQHAMHTRYRKPWQHAGSAPAKVAHLEHFPYVPRHGRWLLVTLHACNTIYV